ncbi:MAG TPA: hypothetical protein VHT75_18475 [Acidimicrobiales bacterium]|nr:hypothetical protein [Acidimicrobiales bacterium]
MVPIQHFLALASPTPVALDVILFAFIIVSGAPSGVLIGLGRFKAVAVLNVVGVVGRLLMGALLAGSSPLVGAIAASMVPGAVLGLGSLIVIRRAKGSRTAWSTPVARGKTHVEPATDAVAGAVLAASVWVIWSIPVFVARHSLGGAQSGGFTAGQLIASGILYLSLPLVTAFYPMVARGRRTDSFRFGLLCIGLISAFAIPGLALLGPPLLTRVYGSNFVASPTTFGILGLSASVVALANFLVWMGRAIQRLVGASYAAALLAVAAEIVLALVWNGSPGALAAGPAVAIVLGVTLAAPFALRLERRASPPLSTPPSVHVAGGPSVGPSDLATPDRGSVSGWMLGQAWTAVRRYNPDRIITVAVGVGALLALGVVRSAAATAPLAIIAMVSLVATAVLGYVELRIRPTPATDAGPRQRPSLWLMLPRRNEAERANADKSAVEGPDRKQRRQWRWATAAVGGGAATIAQSWFHAGTAIASGDVSPPFGTAWLARIFQPWAWSGANVGGPNAMARQLPWAAVLGTVHRLGGSEVLAQRLWLTGLFAGAAMAVLALMRALGFKPIPSICGAAVYLLNARTVLLVPNDVYLAAFLLFPALPAIIIATSRRRIRMGTAVILLGLSAPLLGFSAENPPLALMVVALTLAAVALAAGMGGRDAGRQALRCLFLGGAVLVLTSCYWVVPALLQSGGAATSALAASSSWIWTEGRATLANAFWLNNSWGWYYPQYFPFAFRYDAQPLAFLKYALPATAFLALAPFTRRTGDAGGARNAASGDDRWAPPRLAIPVALGVLFIILISTGTNFPGSIIFNFLYGLPLGWLLREPGRFLTVAALGYSILVTITVQQVGGRIYRRVHSRRVIHGRGPTPSWAAILGTVLVCAITIGPGYPIVAGAAIPDHRPILPSAHVALPGYWRDMATAIDAAPQAGAVTLLPPDDFYQVPYTWGYYGSDSFLPQMVRRPVIAPVPQGYLGQSGQLLAADDQLASALLDHDWRVVRQTLALLRSPLLLVRLDIDRSGPLGANILSPADLAAAAAEDPDLHLEHSAGQLRLYALSVPLPAQEAVTNIVTVESPTPDLRALSLLPDGTHLITGPPESGIPVDIPVPDPAVWALDGDNLVFDVTEPAGWKYRIESYPISGAPAGAEGTSASGTTDATVPVVGSTSLGDGDIRLSIPAGQSLIQNGDFAQGPWGPVGDCDNVLGAAAGVSQEIGPFGPGKQDALALVARLDTACAQQRLDWQSGPIRLDLMVRHVSGQSARICVYELGPDRCAPIADLPVGAGWNDYRSLLTPDAGTNGLLLFLYSDGNGSRNKDTAPTRNEFAQVRVSAAPTIRVALFGQPVESVVNPQSLLVFPQQYNTHWIGPPGTRHVLVDGLYNGWLGPSAPGFRPRYAPAATIRAATAVSALAAVVLIAVLFNELSSISSLRRRMRWRRRKTASEGD